MEQDTPTLEVALRTHSSRGHAHLFRAFHDASTFANPTPQEMDTMTQVLQ